MAKAESLSFEQLLDRLEGIVGQLETADLSLEDALSAYQEGVNLARQGHARLEDAERKLEVLARDGTLQTLPEPEE